MLGHPSDCGMCRKLRKLTQRRLLLEREQTVAVQTWCRICGLPVFLEVLTTYEEAKTNLYALDDARMVHKNIHAEQGGWGVHWRFDEVLEAVFPEQHRETCWPKAAWYRYSEAEEMGVVALTKNELRDLAPRLIDVERKLLIESINRHPRTRAELLEISDQVWDTEEVSQVFEILGFRAPFAIAIDKRTGEKGSLLFQHDPRLFFAWDSGRVI